MTRRAAEAAEILGLAPEKAPYAHLAEETARQQLLRLYKAQEEVQAQQGELGKRVALLESSMTGQHAPVSARQAPVSAHLADAMPVCARVAEAEPDSARVAEAEPTSARVAEAEPDNARVAEA